MRNLVATCFVHCGERNLVNNLFVAVRKRQHDRSNVQLRATGIVIRDEGSNGRWTRRDDVGAKSRVVATSSEILNSSLQGQGVCLSRNI